MEKKEHHDGNEHERFYDGGLNIFNAGSHGQGCVERDDVIQTLRESRLRFLHYFPDRSSRGHRVTAWCLIDCQQCRRLAVETANNAIVLSSQLYARNVFQSQNPRSALRAYDDLSKLFRGWKSSRSTNRIGELLSRWNRFAADLACWIDSILRPDCIDNLRHSDAQARQFVRIDPAAHRILPCAEYGYRCHPWHSGQCVIQIDSCVVRKKNIVVGVADGR